MSESARVKLTGRLSARRDRLDIEFVSISFRLRLEKDVADPLVLYGIKKHFEQAFHRRAGCPLPACKGCESLSCAYHAAFARSISTDPAAVRKFQKPSLPFIFSFPLIPSLPNEGKECTIRLVLIGSAVNHFLLYVSALRAVLREKFRFLFSITDVATEGYCGDRQSVMDGDDIVLEKMQILSFNELQQGSCMPAREIGVRLRSPLLILSDGRPLKNLNFTDFVRPLLRRISSLAFYYAGHEMAYDFAWLAQQSTQVHSGPSDIRWNHWGGEVGRGGIAGLSGSCIFRGDLAEFYPLLLFGEYVHVGKGASFGLGWYELDVASGKS